jgi:hypothetical protein
MLIFLQKSFGLMSRNFQVCIAMSKIVDNKISQHQRGAHEEVVRIVPGYRHHVITVRKNRWSQSSRL